MIFTSFSKDDNSYTFNGQNGEKMIVPICDIILVDDESGAITVKNTASRCVLGYFYK